MLVKKPEPWQQTLKLISQCPVCGQNYDNKKVELFLNKKNAQMLHITCGQCQGYFIAMVMVFGRGISTVGMVTDLSFADIKRLHTKQPIEVDEIIELNQQLRQSIATELV
jgi:transcription elongation factor Elf1